MTRVKRAVNPDQRLDPDYRRSRSCGFSLLELVIVVTILSVLAGLLLPAVQHSRERARSLACQDNLKNISLAVHNFETAHRAIVGPYFDAHPNLGRYRTDRGLFIELLPFLEQSSVYDSLEWSRPVLANRNIQFSAVVPKVLVCPSTFGERRLTELSTQFSGPPDAGVASVACDYSGNGGAMVDSHSVGAGAIRIRIDGLLKPKRLSEILDGASNTLLAWESAGTLFKTSRSAATSMDSHAPGDFTFLLDRPGLAPMQSNTQASTKSYLYSWTGLRIGGVYAYDRFGNLISADDGIRNSRTINVANDLSQPFSLHAAGCNVSLVDGSVSFVSANIDSSVMRAKAIASDQE